MSLVEFDTLESLDAVDANGLSESAVLTAVANTDLAATTDDADALVQAGFDGGGDIASDDAETDAGNETPEAAANVSLVGDLDELASEGANRIIEGIQNTTTMLGYPVVEVDFVQSAEREIASLAIQLAGARETVKSLKKEHDEAVERLIGLKAFAGPKTPPIVSSCSVSSESVDDANASSLPVSAFIETSVMRDMIGPHANWRQAETATALRIETIDGLGAKKRETLLTKCPTIGDLEDLRAGDGIDSLKGFGPVIVSEIENRLIDFLTNTRDAGAFESFAASAASDATNNADSSTVEWVDDETGEPIATTTPAASSASDESATGNPAPSEPAAIGVISDLSDPNDLSDL